MLKVFVIAVITFAFCSHSSTTDNTNQNKTVIRYDKNELENIVSRTLERGASKDKVIQFLQDSKITKFSYVQLRNAPTDDPIHSSIILRAGKKISIKGEYRKEVEDHEWDYTYYGLSAGVGNTKMKSLEGDKVIWIRFNFDEYQRLIACFITEESDSI